MVKRLGLFNVNARALVADYDLDNAQFAAQALSIALQETGVLHELKVFDKTDVTQVQVMYFKPSGKYYTEEVEEVNGDLTAYEIMFEEMPKRHRIKDMYMLIQEMPSEVKETGLYPQLFLPKEVSE